MFEKNEEIEKATDSLWEAFGNRKPGETITWKEIEQYSGPHLIHPGPSVVDAFRKKMRLERKIVCKTVVTVGLYLCTPSEALVYVPLNRGKRARRQTQRLIKELDAISPAHLTLPQRRVLSQQQHYAKRNRLMLGRAYREVTKAVTPTETNPRRKSPA